jgi:hypothetical protein
MKEVISRMVGSIRGYNKFMTLEKIEKMSIDELLANCHPEDRKDYESELGIKEPTFAV